jgi:hypothetical protein
MEILHMAAMKDVKTPIGEDQPKVPGATIPFQKNLSGQHLLGR